MLVLLAAVATGAVATTVTWVTTDFYNTSPDTFTKYDVTVTTTNQARMSNFFYGNGVNTFTTTLGNFTKIEIVFMPESSPLNISGWDYEVIEYVQPDPQEMPDIWEYTSKLTWTGDAESVSIQGSVMNIKSITFTIADAVTGYGVSLKEDTEDATSWQGKAGEGEYQALPLTGLEAGTAVTVKYNGTKKVKSVKAVKKAPATTPLDNTTTAWTAGSYAVPAGGLTYSDAITVSGDVTLTLTDGETLTLNKGISLASGATLTIEGNGTMNVNGTNYSTASTVAGTGTLVLTSGTLNAKGGNGQGVGDRSMDTDNRANAGGNAINGNVTVSGGTLTATGGNGGGVGAMSGGSYGAVGAVAISGNVTITDGTVTATGGNGGSIGALGFEEYGGNGGAAIGGDATISGGTWTATDGTHGVNDDGQGGAGGKAVAGTVTDNR